MLKYLEDSEALKIDTRESKEQVLSPNEPRVRTVRIARQARSEESKKLFQIFSRQEVNEIQVASFARWEEHLRMLVVLERECLALREEVEHSNEKQEVLTVLVEAKMSMQKVAREKYQEKIFEEFKELEEQKTREAMELVQRKHKLVTSEGEGNEQGCCKGWSCQAQ